MAETVVKTVENVDRLFSQIVVNGEVYESENYVAPTPSQSTPQTQPVVTPETQPSAEQQNVQGEDIYGVDLNGVLHDFVDDTVPDKIQQAVESLDVPSSGGSGKYIKSISQTDGKITATEGDITDSVTSESTDPVTSGAVYTALSSFPSRANIIGVRPSVTEGWKRICKLATDYSTGLLLLSKGYNYKAPQSIVASFAVGHHTGYTAKAKINILTSFRQFTTVPKLRIVRDSSAINYIEMYFSGDPRASENYWIDVFCTRTVISENLADVTDNPTVLVETTTDETFITNPTVPSVNGRYYLQCAVASGVPSYSWARDFKYSKFTATTFRPAGFQIVCTGLVKIDFIKYSDTGEVLEYVKGYIDGSENLAMVQEKSANASLFYDSTNARFVINCSMNTGEKKLTVATILSGEITTFAFY